MGYKLPKKLPAVNLGQLEQDFNQLQRLGVIYGYGIKAPTKVGGKAIALKDVTPKMIADADGSIDCSGWSRWGLARSTDGVLDLPEGSQQQLEFFEECAAAGLCRKVKYADAAKFMTKKRLFICFIKVNTNGCGDVGHVWAVAQYDDGNNGTLAGTLESHGGGGCVSRAWNNLTLIHEVYAVFELPTK